MRAGARRGAGRGFGDGVTARTSTRPMETWIVGASARASGAVGSGESGRRGGGERRGPGGRDASEQQRDRQAGRRQVALREDVQVASKRGRTASQTSARVVLLSYPCCQGLARPSAVFADAVVGR